MGGREDTAPEDHGDTKVFKTGAKREYIQGGKDIEGTFACLTVTRTLGGGRATKRTRKKGRDGVKAFLVRSQASSIEREESTLCSKSCFRRKRELG